MDSINPACNPLKHRYDACFIKWVEGYLEPLPTASSSSSSSSSAPTPTVDPGVRAKEKAEEYERLCGESWRDYKECVWKAVHDKDLLPMLNQAREENPLITEPSFPARST